MALTLRFFESSLRVETESNIKKANKGLVSGSLYHGEFMNKLLEKTLKTGIKENKCTIGTKQVLGSLKNSKTIVISESVQKNILNKIKLDAKKIKIPMVQFKGTSVALGKLCGLPFRVSIVSLNSISDSTIKSILKEAKEK